MGYVKVIEARALHETEKALLVEVEGEKHWIPKAAISDDSETFEFGTDGNLIILEAIAESKGIDGEPYEES